MFTPSILKAARELEIKSKRRVSSPRIGNMKSLFKGSGIQFKEFRNYEYGDDVRNISWAATARTQTPTLKVYEEERELILQFFVDISGSTLFGESKRKLDIYYELSAVIGLAALDSGDSFGLTLFNDRIKETLLPRRSLSHLKTCLDKIKSQSPIGKQTDIAMSIKEYASQSKTRSLILIFSDFISPPFEKELKVITKRNEVVLIQVYDPMESGKIKNKILPIFHPETGEYYPLDGQSERLKKKLNTLFIENTLRLKKIAQQTGAGFLSLNTEDDYLKTFTRYFISRGF